MFKVVLDANQIVSTVLKGQSKPAQILQLIKSDFVELLTTDNILAELERVLNYPKIVKRHKLTPAELLEFLEELRQFSHFTPGKLEIHAVKNDPTDDKYLVCAVEGNADFIISGDHHLKDLKIFRGIPIVDPATFLEYYEQYIEAQRKDIQEGEGN